VWPRELHSAPIKINVTYNRYVDITIKESIIMRNHGLQTINRFSIHTICRRDIRDNNWPANPRFIANPFVNDATTVHRQ